MRRGSFLAVILIAAVAPGLSAQGVLNYPDVFYYKFEEGQGDQVINYAIPGGSQYIPNFETAGLVNWVTGAPGLAGSNWAWDDAGLNRLLSNGPTQLSQSFTIEMWIRTNYTVAPTCTGFCSIGRLFGDYSISLFRCYVGWDNPGVNYYGGGFGVDVMSTYPLNQSSVVACDMGWHHIAWVYDQTAATFTTYFDGNVDQTATGVVPNANGTLFQLGGVVGAGNPFNGVIDEFRWWGEARDQAQIIAGMMASPQGPTIHAHGVASRRSGNTPLLVQFRDFSETQTMGGITSWAWDVDGDGLTDYTDQNPCHAYGTPGQYNVTLTVSDGMGNMDTITYPNYVNAGPTDFVFTSCGQADLYLGAPPPPMGWIDGFTLISSSASGPVGFGPFFGLYPDSVTFAGIAAPGLPGNPVHFINNGNTSLYPYVPIVLPPGSAPFPPGFSLDAVVVYRDASLGLLAYTGASRVTF